MFKFKIIKKCYQDATRHNDDDVDFYLEENDWDDYHYRTSYDLHASKALTKSTNKHLGSIRIMKKGQEERDSYLLRNAYQDKGLVFSTLSDEFVSLTFSLDLYQELNRLLTPEQRAEFIAALRLIMGEDSEFYDASLSDDACFTTSLLRDSASLDDYYLRRGKQLLEGGETLYDLREQNLKIHLSHMAMPIDIDFSCVDDFSSDLLPNGIAVFIGKNGSGKSTAIYRLAKLLYSDPTNRFYLNESVGKLIEPNSIGVNKLFLITYSPFDNFVMPAITNDDYKTMFSEKRAQEQRFVFCGIRDIKKEYEDQQQGKQQVEGRNKYVLQDRQEHTWLKSIEQLSSEFAEALNVIFLDNGFRYNLWQSFCEDSKNLQPSLYKDITNFVRKWHGDENEYDEDFKNLSTGHKFLLHAIVHLIAYIDDDSLVLFDEPENHLHPPLLSFLMMQMRAILSKYKSVMLIATHSPVVLQEVFAKNVYIVSRDGGNTVIRGPRIETYGENISAITSEVFDLTTDITKFYDAFDYLYEKWNMKGVESVESMLSAFKEKVGHPLSNQMESYLINLYERE